MAKKKVHAEVGKRVIDLSNLDKILFPDDDVTKAEVIEYCRARLAHFKTPKYVKFVSSFPTTVTGKIQKFKIREQAIQDLGLADVSDVETA